MRRPPLAILAVGGLLAALGIAVIARTLAAGVGGGLGLVLGALLVAAGVLRIVAETWRRR